MKAANLVVVIVFIAFIFGLTIADLSKKPTEISLDERRKLAQPPALNLKRVLDGSFAQDYATFLQDQVVLRDTLRAVKSFVELRVLRRYENNGVYVVDGEIYDQFYGINQRYIVRAASLINGIIASSDFEEAYLAIIPSKAHMLDRQRYLLSDQNEIADSMKQQVYASYVDLMDLFGRASEGLFYRTDHHWTTKGAILAYEALILAMGYAPIEEYEFEEITDSFVGSNYGKAALRSIEKDKIHLAHNDLLDSLSVCRYETAEAFRCFDSVYLREKANGLDPYDLFLGGADPIIIIENERAQGDQELLVFKDSYAHALAPFLAQHFRRVVLFDLRYVRKELIFSEFDLSGKTVLFLYSTVILNTEPQILN